MKIYSFALLTAFTVLYSLASTADASQQNVALSVVVAENIFSYVEGANLMIQRNFERPLLISVSNDDRSNFQYIETQQKIRVPMASGSTITLTDSL